MPIQIHNSGTYYLVSHEVWISRPQGPQARLDELTSLLMDCMCGKNEIKSLLLGKFG